MQASAVHVQASEQTPQLCLYPSQWENFKLLWLPALVLMTNLELFVPWWLENWL